jgi:hypothetical protein
MGEVMLDVMDSSTDPLARENFADGVFDTGSFADISKAIENETGRGTMGEDKAKAAEIIYVGVTVDGDVVDLVQLHPRFAQAPID